LKKGKRMMKYWKIMAILIIMLVVAACGGTSGQDNTSGPAGSGEAASGPTEAPMAGSGEAQVTMRNRTFQPAEITVAPGTTVTWTNDDSFAHTVTSGTRGSPTDLFDSGNVAGGESFSFTFDQPGTYPYFCRIHSGMDGTVIVQP
jgi:plastocyanin